MISRAGFWRVVELPLLVKELNEQAAQKRTYIIRFLYAFMLFSACTMLYVQVLSTSSGSSDVFGRGRALFEQLVNFQFWSIYLFLPAVSCGALTVEKERNTLGLLLITSLRPGQIIVQKVLGRVVPMVTYVLLSFPLMAIAYSFGGVTEDYLWSGILLLILTCVQVGALAVACSAFFSTTVEAYIANYAVFLVLRGLAPIAWGSYLFERAAEAPFASIATQSIPLVVMTLVFLIVGARVLESRAFIPPKNVLLNVFRWLDRQFNEMNSITGGVVLVKDGEPLPGRQPVAWRETAKKSLGTFRYLFRVLVVFELPLLFICQSLRIGGPGGADLAPVTYSLYVLWLLGTAMVVVHAGTVISAERTRQSLDVLLTTPLAGRDILLEKLHGVRRLHAVLLVPFLTIFAFETWWNQGAAYRWIYPLLGLATVAIYLPLVAWVALWVGLKVRSQMKAVLTTFALIGGWVALPQIVEAVLGGVFGFRIDGLVERLLLLNPAALIPAVEGIGRMIVDTSGVRNRPLPTSAWFLCVSNLALHGAALWAVRRHCLRQADRLLGRLGDEPPRTLHRVHAEPLASPAQQMAT